MASGGVRTIGNRLAAPAGAATAILGILGLAGVVPKTLLGIAAITGGLALLWYGGAVAGRIAAIASGLSDEDTNQLTELGINAGGYSAAQGAGCASIVLGILALLGVASDILPPIAVIVLGGALLYSAGSINRLLAVTVERAILRPVARVVAREHAAAAVGGYAMAGVAGVALGILAVVITGASAVLALVAFLALGASLLGGTVRSAF